MGDSEVAVYQVVSSWFTSFRTVFFNIDRVVCGFGKNRNREDWKTRSEKLIPHHMC